MKVILRCACLAAILIFALLPGHAQDDILLHGEKSLSDPFAVRLTWESPSPPPEFDVWRGVSRDKVVGLGVLLVTTDLFTHTDANPPPRAFYRIEPECRDDGSEENDSRAGASTFFIAMTENLQICPGDEDWFTCIPGIPFFELLGQIEFDHAAGDLDLVLYGSDPDTPLFWSSRGGNAEWLYFDPLDDPGPFYFRIIGVDGARNAYRATFQCGWPPWVCGDDSLEPNNTAAEATPVTPEADYFLFLCDDDEDWFALDLITGSTLVIEAGAWILDVPSPVALIELLDTDAATVLASESLYDGVDAFISHTPDHDGRYYVRASHDGPPQEGEYGILFYLQ